MLVITLALARKVNRTAVRNKGVIYINIYMLKKVFVHKITVALVVCAVKPYILVKVYRDNLAKVNISLPLTNIYSFIYFTRFRFNCLNFRN